MVCEHAKVYRYKRLTKSEVLPSHQRKSEPGGSLILRAEGDVSLVALRAKSLEGGSRSAST